LNRENENKPDGYELGDEERKRLDEIKARRLEHGIPREVKRPGAGPKKKPQPADCLAGIEPEPKAKPFEWPYKQKTAIGYIRKYFFVGEGLGFKSPLFLRNGALSEPVSRCFEGTKEGSQEAFAWYKRAKREHPQRQIHLYVCKIRCLK